MNKYLVFFLFCIVSGVRAQDKLVSKRIDSINLVKKEIHQKLESLDAQLFDLVNNLPKDTLRKILAQGVATKTSTCASTLYAEPDHTSEILQVISGNSPITLFARRGLYYRALYNGNLGYVLFNTVPESIKSLALGRAEKGGFSNNDGEQSKLEVQKQKEQLADLQNDVQSIKDKIQEELDYYEAAEGILIMGISLDINSVGGVSPIIKWKFNKSDRIIKYIEFTLEPYNAVGDVQKSRYTKEPRVIVRLTGPILAKNEVLNSSWENAWYDSSISCVKIKKVKVEYMDGGTSTYVRYLPRIVSTYFANDCAYKDGR